MTTKYCHMTTKHNHIAVSHMATQLHENQMLSLTHTCMDTHTKGKKVQTTMCTLQSWNQTLGKMVSGRQAGVEVYRAECMDFVTISLLHTLFLEFIAIHGPKNFSHQQILLFSISLNCTSVLCIVFPINTCRHAVMNQSEVHLHSGNTVHLHPRLSPRPSLPFQRCICHLTHYWRVCFSVEVTFSLYMN